MPIISVNEFPQQCVLFAFFTRILQEKLDQPVSAPPSPRDVSMEIDSPENMMRHIRFLKNEVERLKKSLRTTELQRKWPLDLSQDPRECGLWRGRCPQVLINDVIGKADPLDALWGANSLYTRHGLFSPDQKEQDTFWPCLAQFTSSSPITWHITARHLKVL